MAADVALINSIHRAFINFSLRAEKSNESILVDNFVDSAPLIDVLSSSNNQIIYGRRGTGKTHALRVVSDIITRRGEVPIFIDLRSIGSNTSIYNDLSRSLASRASQLISDVLETVLSSVYSIACDALEGHPHPEQVTVRLDDFQRSLASVRTTGTAESEETSALSQANKLTASVGVGNKEGLALSLGGDATGSNLQTTRTKQSGDAVLHIDFADLQSALSGLLEVAGVSRLWLMVDEWSEVPLELQPYLADLLRRTCFPVNRIVVKIAAIEHRSNFNIRHARGEYIGFELGADISANLNLDDFLVFDADEGRSI